MWSRDLIRHSAAPRALSVSNKSLSVLLLVKPNNAYCARKKKKASRIARYNEVIQVVVLASLARNVKAVKTFHLGCIGTPKADIAIAYCTLNNFRPVANK